MKTANYIILIASILSMTISLPVLAACKIACGTNEVQIGTCQIGSVKGKEAKECMLNSKKIVNGQSSLVGRP